MNLDLLKSLYSLDGKVVVATGGSGVLGSAICMGLAQAGADIAILARNIPKAEHLAEEIRSLGVKSAAISCDVNDKPSIEQAAQSCIEHFGQVDILINAAGGNEPAATTRPDLPFFDLDPLAIQSIFALNLLGAIQTSQVFSRYMVAAGEGVIVNISSMASYRPLTRTISYSAAKAGINNFTQWLAVHLAQEYSPLLRVNAIAPGFFMTEQNEYLLVDEDHGDLTDRGQAIISHTPMGRFGLPNDLVGTVLWLVSPASKFVTGVVVPVDGGFSAFSGV
jgi:NAD(P)-dependent dehydrogenase (short-subunit alcohol dehydrogenase family)